MSGGQDPDQWSDIYDPDSLTLHRDYDAYVDDAYRDYILADLFEQDFIEGGES